MRTVAWSWGSDTFIWDLESFEANFGSQNEGRAGGGWYTWSLPRKHREPARHKMRTPDDDGGSDVERVGYVRYVRYVMYVRGVKGCC